MRHVNGHIEVYDKNEGFLFSADTTCEAYRELDSMEDKIK